MCHKALWKKEAWQDFPHFLVDSPSHVMALPAKKSLFCVVDEVHVSPFCSLTYYFFKVTGCWGLGRVVWVLRLVSEEFLSGGFVWASVWVQLLHCNSPGSVLQEVFVQPLLPLVLLEQCWTLVREV